MSGKNNITGDLIKSKAPTKAYLDNHDRIFGNKVGKQIEIPLDEPKVTPEGDLVHIGYPPKQTK